MKSTIFSSAIAIFATLATALPTAAPAETADNLIARDHVKQVISSSAVANIREDTPDVPFNGNGRGIVSRTDNKHNFQALVKFDFPDGLTGSKCQLAFAHPSQFAGTREIQVFSIGDANIENATFNKRPFRDQFKGTFRVEWGEATVLDGSGLTFDCPAKGAKAYEVVSAGDSNEVLWDAPSAGLKINVL